MNNVADLIKQHEGCRLEAYCDTRGVLTIGYGHTGHLIVEGTVWTQEQADDEFAADLAIATLRAKQVLGAENWATLDPVRQAALIDMAFELGGDGLAAFVWMLAAIRA